MDDIGTVIYDEAFDLSDPDAQQFILDVCEEIAQDEELAYNEDSVRCVMAGYKTWREDNGETFPSDLGSKEAFDADFKEYLDTAEGQHYWSNNDVGYIDDEMKYLSIETNSPQQAWQSRKKTKPLRDHWNNYIINKNEYSYTNGLTGAERAFHCTLQGNWNQMQMEKALIDGSFTGILIAIPCAYLCLVIFTGNWIIATYAVSSIIGVMTTVALFTVVVGWDFGIIESVSVVIVIGFSVDYNVHLGHSYLESPATDRLGRMGYSLTTMGISVVSGAVTTGLSGFPLTFSMIVFLEKWE
eukprot:UN30502